MRKPKTLHISYATTTARVRYEWPLRDDEGAMNEQIAQIMRDALQAIVALHGGIASTAQGVPEVGFGNVTDTAQGATDV